jgi:RNA polymerase sigma-B factor
VTTATEPTTATSHRAAELERLLARICEPGDVWLAAATLPAALGEGVGASPVDPMLWRAHVCYNRTRDAGLRRQLVEEYQGYAVSLARRMHREGEPLEDLIQVAFEGLLVALNRFETTRGIPFVGFATPTIMGALKRHYRDAGWLMRVPRRVHELATPARLAEEALTAELGRAPSLDETAKRLGVDVEDLIVVQEAQTARSMSSIEALSGTDGEARGRFGATDPGIGKVDDRLALKQAFGELGARDREVVRLYFFEERSQVDIASRFGVSQMQVSRWISAIARRMGSWIPAD